MKTAVVIGASSGIGKELAQLLVKDQYQVVITGRRQKLLEALKSQSPEHYFVFQQDVTDLERTVALFDYLKSDFESIDLIVYNSGIGSASFNLEWENEYPIINTNVVAALKVYGLAYNVFREQGYGHLVGVSSVASIRGNRHAPAYFASKAFQASYLESLYMKAKRSKAKIYVTDIQPGFVDTKMALGKTFWMSSVEKATRQIYIAIKRKKKKAYITRRWRIIGTVLKFVPASIINKL